MTGAALKEGQPLRLKQLRKSFRITAGPVPFLRQLIGIFDGAAGLVSHSINLLLWHEERHPILAADEGLGDRHKGAPVAEELDPEIGAGQPPPRARSK